ncbi:metallophosphoesterase [Bacillus sp. FJAT-49705]|uniref:Metallophosphoesterase n=1 Tax=Cytobacillus citreus TaxID=2833586 RepID=A0ABS5NPB0_9BACI|nr:metallophosphoesterase [Cytobacillus citreus]MBS4189661.1 metallophosphoesterase [Cytobacillus citreus]
MSKLKKIAPFILILVIMLNALSSTNAQNVIEPAIRLRIMETTDLHANMIGFDYEKNKPKIEYGFARTASLIKEARKEEPNTLLFDVGDVLVGNALGEYAYLSHYLNPHDIHPVFKAMNLLNYDAATVGNHEFNYGLDFLQVSLQGANFPYVNANIYIDDHNDFEGDDLNYFNPYIILDRQLTDSNGKKQTLKVGVIGFITPITAEWDKEYFQDKLIVKNIKKTAEHFVPIMKDKGADIIIALAHVGMEADKGLKEQKGNSVFDLSEVEGITAILYGHSHALFPSDDGHIEKGIDHKTGTINGTPAVQAGFWGNHLGIIDLDLIQVDGKWVVKSSQSSVRPIFQTINNNKIPIANEDPDIVKAIMYSHIEALMNK